MCCEIMCYEVMSHIVFWEGRILCLSQVQSILSLVSENVLGVYEGEEGF